MDVPPPGNSTDRFLASKNKKDLTKRFSKEQIFGFVKQAKAGVAVNELWRQHGFTGASLYT